MAIGLVAIAIFGLLLSGRPAGQRLSPIALAAERTAELPGGRFAFVEERRYSDAVTAAIRGAGYFNSRPRAEYTRMGYVGNANPLAPRHIQVIRIGRRSWSTSEVIAPLLPDGDRWQFAIAEKKEYREALKSELLPAGEPRLQLELVEEISGRAVEVGTEQVRGVETTRYRAELDAEKYVDFLRRNDLVEHPQLRLRQLRLQGGLGLLEAWVDEDGLLRRTEVTRPDAIGGGKGAVDWQRTEYFGFGDVPVVHPPAEGVVFNPRQAGRKLLEKALAGSGPGWIGETVDRGRPLSRPQFVARANAICADFERPRYLRAGFRFGKLFAQAKGTYMRGLQGSEAARHGYAPLLERLSGSAEWLYALAIQAIQRMARLNPPARDRALVDRWLRIETESLAPFVATIGVIEDGWLTPSVYGQPSTDPLKFASKRIERSLGIKTCSRDE